MHTHTPHSGQILCAIEDLVNFIEFDAFIWISDRNFWCMPLPLALRLVLVLILVALYRFIYNSKWRQLQYYVYTYVWYCDTIYKKPATNARSEVVQTPNQIPNNNECCVRSRTAHTHTFAFVICEWAFSSEKLLSNSIPTSTNVFSQIITTALVTKQQIVYIQMNMYRNPIKCG